MAETLLRAELRIQYPQYRNQFEALPVFVETPMTVPRDGWGD